MPGILFVGGREGTELTRSSSREPIGRSQSRRRLTHFCILFGQENTLEYTDSSNFQLMIPFFSKIGADELGDLGCLTNREIGHNFLRPSRNSRTPDGPVDGLDTSTLPALGVGDTTHDLRSLAGAEFQGAGALELAEGDGAAETEILDLAVHFDHLVAEDFDPGCVFGRAVVNEDEPFTELRPFFRKNTP